MIDTGQDGKDVQNKSVKIKTLKVIFGFLWILKKTNHYNTRKVYTKQIQHCFLGVVKQLIIYICGTLLGRLGMNHNARLLMIQGFN